MAEILGISRQGYYHYINKTKSKTELYHEYLTKEIKRVFSQHEGRYGSPRIAIQLYDEGIETNKRVVSILMQKAGLYARGYHPRRHYKTKDSGIEEYVRENLVKRQFDRTILDEIWVTDITYVKCADGRLYLSTYIDLTTRIPRCYQVSTNMKRDIVIDPIRQYSGILPRIIHSDHGSQYTSRDYRTLLETKHILHSMSEPGTPVDNAVIESFHRTIKRELIYPNHDKSKAEMRVLIEDYLNRYFIYERIHTKFGMTPHQYEISILNDNNN